MTMIPCRLSRATGPILKTFCPSVRALRTGNRRNAHAPQKSPTAAIPCRQPSRQMSPSVKPASAPQRDASSVSGESSVAAGPGSARTADAAKAAPAQGAGEAPARSASQRRAARAIPWAAAQIRRRARRRTAVLARLSTLTPGPARDQVDDVVHQEAGDDGDAAPRHTHVCRVVHVLVGAGHRLDGDARDEAQAPQRDHDAGEPVAGVLDGALYGAAGPSRIALLGEGDAGAQAKAGAKSRAASGREEVEREEGREGRHERPEEPL